MPAVPRSNSPTEKIRSSAIHAIGPVSSRERAREEIARTKVLLAQHQRVQSLEEELGRCVGALQEMHSKMEELQKTCSSQQTMIMALEADKRELQARLLKPVVPNQEKAVAASED